MAFLPALASAETCTNTWTGPEKGNWSEASHWSAGHAPTAADIACVAAAEVEVTEGANHAAYLDGEGTLELAGGSLELTGLGTASTISALLVDDGELKIAAGVQAEGKFIETARGGSHTGSISVGANAELTYHEIIMYGGSMSLGSKTQLTGVQYLSVEVGAKFESGSGSTINTSELFAEGVFGTAGTVEANFLRSQAGTIGGGGRITTQEAYLGKAGSVATLSEIQLMVAQFGRIQGTLVMANGALLENNGEFYVDSDDTEAGYTIQVATSSATAPKILNTGEFAHNTPGTATVGVAFENLGQILEYEGNFQFINGIIGDPSITWGGRENPSAPSQPHPTCGDPVSCATGNFSETQTDLSVGGRGVGLILERTYNSQAGAAGVHGALGYGWSTSFSDHLIVEPAAKLATLVQADGSTVPFAEGTGGSYTASAWTQDTLTGTAEAGYTVTLANQTKYHFAGSSGRLESVTDRNGNATTLSYGEAGRLEAVTDPVGRKITLTYNGEGLIESAKDPMGHVVKYAYEGGNLASVIEPGETEPRWRFKYDGSHQLTEMVDGRGGKTINEYNGARQVVSQTDPLKHLLSFEYKAFDTKITNHATGSVTDEHFTSSYLPVSITRGFGTARATTETSSYDAANNVLSTSDGNGHTTKYGYDVASNRTSMRDPDENETKWTYDATHDVVTTTTPKGETTTIERDAHGNATTISRPAPGAKTQITKYKYAAHGELESVTDPLEHTTKYEYNARGDRISEIDPEADKRAWTYNEDSQVTSTVSPRGVAAGGTKEAKYKTTIERDAQDRPTLVVAPLKHETKYSYDGNGNLATVTDPELNKTTYTYDADDEPVKVEQPTGTITETGYDGSGHVTSQTDGNKHTTTYVRNLLGEVTEVIDARSRKTLREYDAAGNLTKLTDAAKRTTKYTYDPANRLTEVDYSSEATPDVKYEYDPDGNRTKMVDGTGTSKYTYDQLDRLTESKDGHGNLTGYEYDLANEQTKITYPSGKAVTRAYDNAGRLKSVTDWLEHTSKFAYDADSDQAATTFPSGTGNEDTYAYNEADRVSEVKMAKGAETLASLVYARNKDGGVTKATTVGLPGEEKPAFTYDNNSRLTKGAGIAYKYDAADNTTKIGTGAYTYDAASQLEKGPSLTYTYDELGERTKTKPSSGPATTFGYDQAGDLSSVARPHEGEVVAIEDAYGYDGNGLRASQTISGSTSYMSWDVSAGLPLLLSDGTNAFVYGPGGLPIEQLSGETVQYLHHDQQGSTRMITGSSGTVAATTTFDAYGNKLGATGTATTALGYDGQYTSADTGLIYLQARVYDPSTAQFMSVDPVGPITRAPYTYAKDNPANFGDPSGLWSPIGTIEDVASGVGHAFVSGGETVVHGALDVAAVGPYALYYGSYELARGVNYLGEQFGLPGEVVSHLAALPLAQLEALGLTGDVAIDALKNLIFGQESICDEGKVGYINPLHGFVPGPLKGPEVYLPGVHENGEIDFEW
jgi:RHS repeat-associated protein